MATGGLSDIEKGTDETFDFLCSMCQGQNKNTEGEHFCADCSDYYCSSCIKVHNVVPALKNHKILNKAQFKPSSSVQFPAVPTERCRVHGHKPVDMFCRQHDSVGCATCMVVQHSNCQDKFYVPDFIKHNTTAANPDELTELLDSLADNLAELLREINKDMEKLKSSKEQSLKQIRKWRIKINHELDELEMKTIQNLEQRFQSLTDKTEANLKELQASANDIQSSHNSLKSAGGNISQMFVSIKTANAVASLVQKKVDMTKNNLVSTEISFIPHPKIQSLLKELQALGDISLTENIRFKPTAPSSLQQATKTQPSPTSSKTPSTTASLPLVTNTQAVQQSYVSQSKLSLIQIKGNNRYNVNVKSDSKPWYIISACTLPDGTIILADGNNNKLKRLDSSYTVTDYCDMPNYPCQVCPITDQELAVSCGFSKIIQFVSVGRTMKKTRQISTEFCCRGLDYADGRLFVSDECTSVYVYSLSGAREQQFSKDQSGQQIFSNIYSLAVSSDHSKIYVADYKKGLIILERNGQLIGQFNGPELKGASGVCLDKNDSVLVSGFDSKNVLQFSPDGKLLGEILKTDKSCLTVCCNKDNTKLIVGLFLTDEIEVYSI